MGKVAMALVGDAARVADVLEEVAREAARSDAPPKAAKAWLLGLVRAACAKQQSRLPLKTRGFESAPTTERVGGAAASARSALAALRPTEREAVVLSIVGGLGVEEIATACSIDVATAKTRLERGLQQLTEGGAR
ncbi:MAG: hypothetical protein KF837_27230 [Labilithrix sp.]|nr:hypothetical protein [Labilithrix sp.]